MLNPIKRVWVPKSAAGTPAKPDAQTAPTPVSEPATERVSAPAPLDTSAEAPTSKRGMLFEELPEPEVSEKFSDSVWAAFDMVVPQNTK